MSTELEIALEELDTAYREKERIEGLRQEAHDAFQKAPFGEDKVEQEALWKADRAQTEALKRCERAVQIVLNVSRARARR